MNIESCRYPVLGASYQPRAGTARHDAVAWGYAMRADEMGVDIIQNCEVKGIKRNGDSVEGIETCLLYTSPSPRDRQKSRMPSSA